MKFVRPLFQYSMLALFLCANSAGFASGFALEEQNAVQTGDFGAGGAAIAEDASTAWYNPAGLIRLTKPQVVITGNEIWFNTTFNGTVNQSIDGYLPTGPVSVSNVQGGTSNFVPTFHAAYPINPNLVAAFSVTTPFGLATDYNADTFVRYATVQTKLRTIDLSPSIGFKLTPKVSLGVGFDEQRLLGNFEVYTGIPAISTTYDTSSHNVVSDWSTGWHSGVLFALNDATRFGLSYQSKITHNASGYSTLTGPLAPNGTSYGLNDANALIDLPAKTEVSAYHDMNNRWAVMGSLSYTQWSVLNSIILNNVATTVGTSIINVPENFRNTWRVSVGTHYKLNDQWLIRTGLGYDKNPTNNTDRNLILPDSDRYGLSIGGRYQATKNLAWDAGFTHEFIKSTGVNNTAVASLQDTAISGKSVNSANVLGLQMTYTFA